MQPWTAPNHPHIEQESVITPGSSRETLSQTGARQVAANAWTLNARAPTPRPIRVHDLRVVDPTQLHNPVGFGCLRRRSCVLVARPRPSPTGDRPKSVDKWLTRDSPGTKEALADLAIYQGFRWWRGQDLNLRPSGYERSGHRLRSWAFVRIRPGQAARSGVPCAVSCALVCTRWCSSRCTSVVRAQARLRRA